MEEVVGSQPIQRTKVILASDEELVRELENTTEMPTEAGYVRYIPAVRGQDHNSDALRCVMAAIKKFAVIGTIEEFDPSEFGWVTKKGGRDYRGRIPSCFSFSAVGIPFSFQPLNA